MTYILEIDIRMFRKYLQCIVDVRNILIEIDKLLSHLVSPNRDNKYDRVKSFPVSLSYLDSDYRQTISSSAWK